MAPERFSAQEPRWEDDRRARACGYQGAAPDREIRHRVEGFERFLGTLNLFNPSSKLVIIDEIGKMECLSSTFRDLVESFLDAPAPFIRTIALKAGGFIDEVKHRKDVQLTEVTERNRDALLPEIAGLVRSFHKEVAF